MNVITSKPSIKIENKTDFFSDLKNLLEKIEKIENTINNFDKKNFTIEKFEDKKYNDYMNKLDPYRNYNLIELSAEKNKIKKEIIWFLEEFFNQNKNEIIWENKIFLEKLETTIIEEISTKNDYSNLKKILNIKDLTPEKLINFSEKQNILNSISSINNDVLKKIKEISQKIEISEEFKNAIIPFLIFLYFKNIS